MRKLQDTKGHTLVELLIALLLTGIISMAGLQFYVDTHNQTLAQEDVSDMQNVARTSLDEIARTLRQAGFKVGSHTPWEILGDTLFVYFSATKAVDTVGYFLADAVDMGHGGGVPTKMLMKRMNSAAADVFCDKLSGIRYTVISPAVIDIVVTSSADRTDKSFADNDGVRTLTVAERVQMRNLNL